MTPLPADFRFSQSSLQDYVDCPRRFELRYLQRLNWPAAESEPIREQEEHMVQGALFHRLVQQYFIGLPVDVLTRSIADERVAEWWGRFLTHAAPELPERRFPEIALSAALGPHRLIAKFDLIAIEPGQRAVIYDWKTSLHRSRRDRLETRVQTILYRYLLARAGAYLNDGAPIAPEQISMIYWFAEFPQQPEVFTYDAEQHQRIEVDLLRLLDSIAERPAGGFPLTDEIDRCKYCRYRSLCQRGIKAGDFDGYEAEEAAEFDLDALIDLDQIGEIAF